METIILQAAVIRAKTFIFRFHWCKMNSKLDFREKRQGFDYICVTRGGLEPSLPADILWGSFVMHSFLPHREVNA